MFLNMLAERLNFMPVPIVGKSFHSSNDQVSYNYFWFTNMPINDRHGALLFQTNKREVDISLVQYFYDLNSFQKNTFIGPVGKYDFHFISGVPQEVQKWLTVIKPFDMYIWVFLLASWVAVTIALIYINKIYNSMLKGPSKETQYQSNFLHFIL